MNVRLLGQYTLRAPLSHIGESISTTAYLVQEPIIQPDGTVEEVFSYSGNAVRGALRDLTASYMLEHLGAPRLPVESFHLLFTGGKIAGDQVVDLHRIRAMRRALPMLALFGGGAGNVILAGKLRVGNAYPLCLEALPVLPLHLHEQAGRLSYRALTFEKSFSRKDDAKDDRLNGYLQGVEPVPVPPLPETVDLFGEAAVKPSKPKPAKAEGPSTQMRTTVELLAAGTHLYHEIDVLDCTEIELGCLVSAFHLFSRSPHLGGQANKGHGRVNVVYHLLDLDTGEAHHPFLRIDDGQALLSEPAAEAKGRYDVWLREQYDAMLAARESELRQLLGD